jgi:hypothetical protein
MKDVQCFFCRKLGHYKSECFALKKLQQTKSVGLVSSARLPVFDLIKCINHTSKVKVEEKFMPFVSEGKVSVNGNKGNTKPIRILRDTGSTQSLMLEQNLIEGESSATGEYIIIKGIEGIPKTVPLHKLYIESGLVTGEVEIGIVKYLPFQGITFLLGNDLAGSKVTNLRVTNEPCLYSEDEIALVIEGEEVFPSCVVTRSQSKRENETFKGKGSLTVPERFSDKVTFEDLTETFLSRDFIENNENTDSQCLKKCVKLSKDKKFKCHDPESAVKC